MSDRAKLVLLFLFLFAFRLSFGLVQNFFDTDELQTYLIGLKCFTTHTWPYFGPDLIVTETGYYSQIPGPLEGLLIGLPFYILPTPEAPFILLNLLSLGALALLARAIYRRVPTVPFLFTFTLISLLPWNLHESTSIINPSYLLFGSILFFVGFLEAVPALTTYWFSSQLGFALMGFGIFWDMQFHFSWILLPPFVAFALYARLKEKVRGAIKSLAAFFLGLLPVAALMLPTFLKYGWSQGAGGVGTARFFNPHNFIDLPLILIRYFYLAGFEIPRFLGQHTTQRLDFLNQAPWLWPPAVFLLLMSGVQFVIFMATGWKFWNEGKRTPVYLAFGILLLVWISFWFTYKEPLAHIYYVLLPVILLYSVQAYGWLVKEKLWRWLGLLCLVASVWLWGGYVIREFKAPLSLYNNRAKVVQAIDQKDYRILGERRPQALY